MKLLVHLVIVVAFVFALLWLKRQNAAGAAFSGRWGRSY
jgi:hypothetical protein